MKQQKIVFALNKKLSKTAVDDIMDILTEEGAVNIDIDYINKIDEVIFTYNKRCKK